MVSSSPKNKIKKAAPPVASKTGAKSLKALKAYRHTHRKGADDMFSQNAVTRCIRAAGIYKAKHHEVYWRLFHMLTDDVEAVVKSMVTHTRHAKRSTVSHDDLRAGLASIGVHYC